MFFIEIRSLAGVNYIRAADVIAVRYTDPTRCSVTMAGGFSIACVESATDIAARIEAAVAEQPRQEARRPPAVQNKAPVEGEEADEEEE